MRRIGFELAGVLLAALLAAMLCARIWLAPALGHVDVHLPSGVQPPSRVALLPATNGMPFGLPGVATRVDAGVNAAPPRVERRGTTVHVSVTGEADVDTLLHGFQFEPVALDAGGGFRITALDERGTLATAGVRVGDVLVAIDGMPTRTGDEMLSVASFARTLPGATFRFRRGASEFDVHAEVGR